MKEKVIELMKIAGTDSSGKWMGIDNCEKLAELIVKECIEVCESGFQGEFTSAGIHQCVTDLREHFGVEE
jgi:hypothetical protein